jgi:hypothetical protein
MQHWKASVSFEYDMEPVVTVRLEIAASRWPGAFRKAAEAAFDAHPNQHARSMVVVLERADGEPGGGE